MPMKSEHFQPPKEETIRSAIGGNRDARLRIIEHYRRLICYMLNKQITEASENMGFEKEMYQFEDLLHDNFIILETAVLNFKE